MKQDQLVIQVLPELQVRQAALGLLARLVRQVRLEEPELLEALAQQVPPGILAIQGKPGLLEKREALVIQETLGLLVLPATLDLLVRSDLQVILVQVVEPEQLVKLV